MEDVAAELGGTGHWYQLYWSRDDDLTASLVRRAEACGSEAIVVTLDTAYLGLAAPRPRPRVAALRPGRGHRAVHVRPGLPAPRGRAGRRFTGRRRRRHPAEPQPRPTPAAVRTLLSLSRNHPGDTRGNLSSPEPRAAVETFLDVFSRPSLTWDDLPRLRELTSLPIVLKGVLHPEDARRAVDAGVDGVWVSNHGGRQVDRSVGALDALPGVVDAVRGAGAGRGSGSDVPVVFDSGVRTGAEAFVALALGATAVGIGRPHVYGLALAGAEGVSEVLRNLLAELDLTLALTGCRTLADVTRDRLVAAPAS